MNRNYSLLSRIRRAAEVFRQPAGLDMKQAQVILDAAIKNGTLPSNDIALKQLTPGNAIGMESKETMLDVHKTTHNMNLDIAWSAMRNWLQTIDGNEKTWYKHIPPRTDPSRDLFLSKVWMEEPILAGVVYSMITKISSLKWFVTGKRSIAAPFAKILSGAAYMGGYNWGGFLPSSAEDFYTTNRGTFWETPRNPDFSLEDLGTIDSLCCVLTGNSQYPLAYWSEETGQKLLFQPGTFSHITSLPSPREYRWGMGYCLVDRAYVAARLLMGLHDYDEEKLNNLPPEGVAAVTGLTMSEFQDALALWQTARKTNNSLTFPQVLWLLGSQPNANVDVKMIGFSQLPESFSRKEVTEQYINTLALAAGMDTAEFWTMGSGGKLGGSAGNAEVQHLKAKGKGASEFVSAVERELNGNLPDDAEYKFDTQDIEEDANAAAVAKGWVNALLPLYDGPKAVAGGIEKENPHPDKPNGDVNMPLPMISGVNTGGNMTATSGPQNPPAEQVITKDQLLRLLVDRGVLPEWIVNDNRAIISDVNTHYRKFKEGGHPDDIAKFEWSQGVLKEVRPPAIILNSAPVVAVVEKPVKPLEFDSIKAAMDFLREKEDEIMSSERNIHGEPIPETEAVRGSTISRRTLHAELERWRKNPTLSKYAMTDAEETKRFGKLQ